MFFFVNQYLLSSNSSIEHAEIKRLKLFKANQTPAKLVTRDFDPIIHSTLLRFGLTDDQLVNMFDFFAGTTNYKGKKCRTEDLHLPFDYQVSSGNNSRTVKDGQRLVAEIFFTGGTIGLVNHVDYYDVAGNITLRQTFDLRGYKAIDAFFGQDGQIHYERYYRPDGSNYLDRYYIQSTQNTPINSLNVLKGYKGRNYYFDGLDELFAFFLKELNDYVEENNSFIADRPAVAIQPVLELSADAKKYLWLPFNHVLDGQSLKNGQLNGLVSSALTTNLKRWDGIIVMTEKQKQALQKRIGKAVPIFAINGTPLKQPLKRIAMNQRRQGQIIYVGRLGNDKQINQLIDIFNQIHKKAKVSHLTIYGYGTPADTQAYKNHVKQVGLEGKIDFAGYQIGQVLNDAFNQAQLLIDTSRTDGQPLAMGEALSHGIPVISYDYPFGPRELIQPGVNGQLVPLNNQNKLINMAVDLLKNSDELQKLNNGAYASIDKFNYNTTWQQWKQIINA